MYKEIIIIIVILVIILSLNYITQNYTKYCVSEISSELNNLREKINNQIDTEEIPEELNNSINSIHNKWDEMYKKLAYYIEHDELEKVETELVRLSADIDMEEYKHCINELETSIFILEHIQQKEKFDIISIF